MNPSALARLLVLSLATMASAQPFRVARPPTLYVPVPPTQAIREALRLHQTGCLAEDFDDKTCARAVRELEAALRDTPRQLDAQLALADALWNQSFREPEGSEERARLRHRSLARYQRLVDSGVPDARPYYALSVLTSNVDTRLRLLRRTVSIAPKHPEAHKDLAWVLLEKDKPEEAAREYHTHLSVSPREGRETDLEDLRFASGLAQRGRLAEAARVYEVVWDALQEESRAERCQVFKSVDIEPYESLGARFAGRVRELRGACDSLEQLAQTLERVDQGQKDLALQELERQVATAPPVGEPYLALQRLYVEKGEGVRAAEVMTRYFQQEQDVRERCRQFRGVSPQTALALEPSLRQELERTCAAQNR